MKGDCDILRLRCVSGPPCTTTLLRNLKGSQIAQTCVNVFSLSNVFFLFFIPVGVFKLFLVLRSYGLSWFVERVRRLR